MRVSWSPGRSHPSFPPYQLPQPPPRLPPAPPPPGSSLPAGSLPPPGLCPVQLLLQVKIFPLTSLLPSRLASLTASLSAPEDLLCLTDSLLSNTSLRSLSLHGCLPSAPVSWAFPLCLSISSHLGLVSLDLSGLPLSLTTDSLHLCLAAFSSNTALSLNSLNISGWSFDLSMTDKTGLVAGLSSLFSTSRLASLDLSGCSVQLSCGPRIHSLYFQEQERGRARCLHQEIHQEKVHCPALRSLNLRGITAQVISAKHL